MIEFQIIIQLYFMIIDFEILKLGFIKLKSKLEIFSYIFIEHSILIAENWFSISDNSFSFCEHSLREELIIV